MSLKDEEPPATSFVNPRKTGWLYKHGGSGVSSHWRKRWFVADNNYLFYYKTPSVSEILQSLVSQALLQDKKPVGLLCLQDYVSCSKAKDCKKPYSFVLDRGDAQGIPDHDNGKNYLLYTDSEKDMMEWIKAMTEEMKGPMRQPSEKTRHLAEKIDQKALEEISKTATEHPKLVHLTADRPKIKNRRPPLKKYTTFHEDDSKEDIPEDDSAAVSQKKLDSVQPVRQKQPLLQSTKSMEDEELIKEPPGSPGHVYKQPLLPKGGSKMAIKPPEDVEVAKVKPAIKPPEDVEVAKVKPAIKPPEDVEVAKVKPLPLPPKKEQSQLLENQKMPTESEQGELEASMQTEPKCKPLPQPPSKKSDTAVSADSPMCAQNKLSTPMSAVGMIAEVDKVTKFKPLPPSPKKKDMLTLTDNKAEQPHTVGDKSNEPAGAGSFFGHEASRNDENNLKGEECISEERTRKSSSASDELPICRSDDSHTESSHKGKPDEVGSIVHVSEAGSKPKPKPRKRVGKEEQAAGDQYEGTELSSMTTEKTEAPLMDPDQSKATPNICNKVSEVAVVPESENQVRNCYKETADAESSEQLAVVNLPHPVDSPTTPPTVESIIEGSVANSSVNQVCSELSYDDKCETMVPEEKGVITSLPQEPVASNLDLVLQEQLKVASLDPVIMDKEENMEGVVRSDSNEISPNPLERDALGYTVIKKDAKGAVLPSVSDIAEHTSSAVPKLFSNC
ncbi:hypothetical protein EMCRGX_G021952 [Ephydatia muelleri]